MFTTIAVSLLLAIALPPEVGVLRGHEHPVWDVQFSPDGKSLASASSTAEGEHPEIRVWDLKTRSRRWSAAPFERWVFELQIAPHGDSVLATDLHSIKQWRLDSGELQNEMRGEADLNAVQYGPHGRLIGAGDVNGAVTLWDAKSGRRIHRLTGHADQVWGVAFSPDGKYVASASADTTIRIWSTQSGELLHVFAGHRDDVTALAFAPRGGMLLSGGYDKRLMLWDVPEKRLLVIADSGHEFSVDDVRFSPDGKAAISVGSASQVHTPSVALWDAATLEKKGVIQEQGASIHETAFSRDSRFLFASKWDQSITVWNLENSQVVGRIRDHTDYVRGLDVSPDGKLLASGSHDTTIRLWSIDKWLKESAGSVGRANPAASGPER